MDYEQGDVVYRLTITPTEAADGTQRSFAFHDSCGRPRIVRVDIPPGIRSGDQVRVAGQGGPSVDRQTYGDLYVAVQIGWPRAASRWDFAQPGDAFKGAAARWWPIRSGRSRVAHWLAGLWRWVAG